MTEEMKLAGIKAGGETYEIRVIKQKRRIARL